MSLSITQISVIMLGGGLGALMRFIVSTAVNSKLGNTFPFGTLTVNVLGSFVFGFLAIMFVERMQLDPLFRLGIFVGFLGAFTTFSTFSLETMNLFEQGQAGRALINMFVSVFFSVLAVWLGMILGKQLS